MKHYSDNEIIEGIAADTSKVLHYVYREYFPYIENYVVQHNGTTDQARDLFQEGMIVVYKKVNADALELYCKFSTYLYAVCKRIWIQDRRKAILRINKMKESGMAAEPTTSYGYENTDEAQELFDKHFKQLSPDCQKILRLHFNECTIEEIRDAMNYNTAHHVMDRKYRCKKSLIDRIKNDPTFRKFLK